MAHHSTKIPPKIFRKCTESVMFACLRNSYLSSLHTAGSAERSCRMETRQHSEPIHTRVAVPHAPTLACAIGLKPKGMRDVTSKMP